MTFGRKEGPPATQAELYVAARNGAPVSGFDPAYAALGATRMRSGLASRPAHARIQKAADILDLTAAPLDELLRMFVDGDQTESPAAAHEIAVRVCTGSLAGTQTIPPMEY